MNLIKLVAFFSIFILKHLAYGQELKTYTERKSLDSTSFYNLNYQYIKVGENRIKEGKFEFFLNTAPTPKEEKLLFYTIHFSSGKINGNFRTGNIVYSEDRQNEFISGFRKQTPLKGIIRQTSGNFKEGSPTGQWHYYSGKYNDEKLYDSAAFAKFSFEKAKLSGLFEYKNVEEKLSYKFNFEDGYFDDKSQLESIGKTPYNIEIEFSKGSITKISYNNDIVEVFKNDFSNDSFKEVAISNDFFIALSSELDAKSQSYNTLVSAVKRMVDMFDNVFVGKIKNTYIDEFNLEKYLPKVKLRVYPLEENEKLATINLLKNILTLETQIDTLVNKKSLVGAKSKAIELEKLYHEILILKDIAEIYRNNILLLNSNSSEYINKVQFIKNFSYQIDRSFDKDFEFNNSVINASLTLPSISNDLNWITYMEKCLEQIENKFIEFENRLNNKMSSLLYEQELLNLQEQIFEISKSLSNQLDGGGIFLFTNLVTEMYKKSFVNKKDFILNAFASEEEDKLEMAKLVLTCLTKLDVLLKNTGQLEKKSDMIHNNFHNLEFNPYTNTQITVLSHPRLFNAYKEKLFPYIIEQLLESSNDFNCINFENKHSNISILQDFMLNTQDEKLRAINKKIRNRDNVETLIQKMEIQFK